MGINCSNLINNYVMFHGVNKNTANNNVTNSVKSEPKTGSENLITRYLNNLGNNNSIQTSKSNETLTPSEVEGYSNYTEYDDKGNKIVDVTYSKEGDAIVQHIKTVSANGTTVERMVKNNNITGDKSMYLKIKDKDGNNLLQREKTYKKINDDTAQTTVNGEEYNISGLSSDIIKVEHNGETAAIDLNKMLNSDVVTGKDENDNPIYRKEKITDEEKEKLFGKIKELHGDDLVRLSKSVNTIQYFAGDDEFFEDKDKTLLLQANDIWGVNITTHELGHGYNHINIIDDKTGDLQSNNENIKNIRVNATKEYLKSQNHTNNDKRFFGKFLDTNQCMEHGGYKNEADANINLQDEIFAESYNILNTPGMITIEGAGCPGRMLSMMKYMPEAFVEVNKTL